MWGKRDQFFYLITGYIGLDDWYQLCHYFVATGYQMSDYLNMYPWEREIFVSLIVKDIQERIESLKKKAQFEGNF